MLIKSSITICGHSASHRESTGTIPVDSAGRRSSDRYGVGMDTGIRDGPKILTNLKTSYDTIFTGAGS